MKRFAMLVIAVIVAIPLFAQVGTTPGYYNGSCEIGGVNTFTGAGWAFASMDFTCSGTFLGNVSDTISVESPNATMGSTWSTGYYASFNEDWPKYAMDCSYWGCFSRVTQPIPSQWHTSTAAYTSNAFVGHGHISWQTDYTHCTWWGCYTPSQSVDAFSGAISGGGACACDPGQGPVQTY